jgi:hypothetical protein
VLRTANGSSVDSAEVIGLAALKPQTDFCLRVLVFPCAVTALAGRGPSTRGNLPRRLTARRRAAIHGLEARIAGRQPWRSWRSGRPISRVAHWLSTAENEGFGQGAGTPHCGRIETTRTQVPAGVEALRPAQVGVPKRGIA